MMIWEIRKGPSDNNLWDAKKNRDVFNEETLETNIVIIN